jgi:hypothetical protein
MKHIASIFTGLSLAVLFFVGSAHAQYDGGRLIANIPFEFTVGNISLPAGQYEFQRAGANLYVVRDASGRSLFTTSSAAIEPTGLTEKSGLKFVTVDGHHLLVQIWSERALYGNEFSYGQSSPELVKH